MQIKERTKLPCCYGHHAHSNIQSNVPISQNDKPIILVDGPRQLIYLRKVKFKRIIYASFLPR